MKRKSPKDWKFIVENTIKFNVETTIETYSTKDSKCNVETAERKLKKNFYWFFEIFVKRRLKIEEKQVKGSAKEEEMEKIVESEGKEGWRGWIFTVIAPNCPIFKTNLLLLLAKLILRGRLLIGKAFLDLIVVL